MSDSPHPPPRRGSPGPAADSAPPRRRRGGNRWALIVVALLITHASAMIIAVLIATGDPSFAVVPDYYQKALSWDQRRAALRGSDSLGWTLVLKPGSVVDERRRRLVVAELHDAQGQPVAEPRLTLSYYHYSHGGQPGEAVLPSTGPGRFAATIPMRWPGTWHVEATVPDTAFLHALDLTIGDAGTTSTPNPSPTPTAAGGGE